jgi:hypothetical protein
LEQFNPLSANFELAIGRELGPPGLVRPRVFARRETGSFVASEFAAPGSPRVASPDVASQQSGSRRGKTGACRV